MGIGDYKAIWGLGNRVWAGDSFGTIIPR